MDRAAGTLVVESVNRVYKHVRRSQKNPQGGRLSKEMPIRVMYYNYDAQGKATAPEVYTFNKGMRAEDAFGKHGTFPHENPFKNKR